VEGGGGQREQSKEDTVHATRGWTSKVDRSGGQMETSQAGACTMRAGVRGTRCQCLKSREREVRCSCSLRVVSAVRAACHAAYSLPLTCRGSHACTHFTCSTARPIKKRWPHHIVCTSCLHHQGAHFDCRHPHVLLGHGTVEPLVRLCTNACLLVCSLKELSEVERNGQNPDG